MAHKIAAPRTAGRRRRPILPRRVDVVVIGAGIVGTSAASFLAAAGHQVLLFDAVEIAHGAWGLSAGAILHPFDLELVELYQRSLDLYREVDPTLLATPRGVLLLTETATRADAMQQRMRAFSELEATVVDPRELRELEPGVYRQLSACRLSTGFPVVPSLPAIGYWERALERGARLCTGYEVSLWWHGNECRGVDAGGIKVEASTVVVAAGPRSGELIADGRDAPEVVSPWSGAIRPSWGVTCDIVFPTPPRHLLLEASYIDQAGQPGRDAWACSIIPTVDGAGAQVGATFLESAAAASPSRWLPVIRGRAEELVRTIRGGSVRASGVGNRPHSFDGLPMIGRVGGVEHLLVATGGDDHGLSIGPAMGERIALAIESGSDDGIPEALRADRVTRWQ